MRWRVRDEDELDEAEDDVGLAQETTVFLAFAFTNRADVLGTFFLSHSHLSLWTDFGNVIPFKKTKREPK